MFPTQVRYAGLALGYNVSTSLFGGTAGLVNQWLIERTGDAMWPAYYTIAACFVGLVALFFTIETKGSHCAASTPLERPRRTPSKTQWRRPRLAYSALGLGRRSGSRHPQRHAERTLPRRALASRATTRRA